MIELRDYQTDLIDRTKAGMRHHKWQLVQLATGGGKTFSAGAMINAASLKGSTSWFIAPRRELVRQTSESFQSVGIHHGIIAAGYSPNPFARVQVCSLGSVVRRLDKLKAPKLAFVDETHFGAGQLNTLIEWLKDNGAYGIGLSATPHRMDGRGLGCWYDNMIMGPSVRDLMDMGNLSEYRAFAPDQPDLSGIKTTAGDYAKGELATRMEENRVLVGSAVKHYKAHADNTLNVTFCASIKHAEIVAQTFRDAGVSSHHISGSMDDAERNRIIRAFARREIMVLTSCQMLQFGFDLSSAAQMDVTIESMSDLQPTQSLAMQVQKWGRVLRKKPYPAIILDHSGNIGRHGLPDDDREWSLEGRDKKSRAGVEKTEPTRQCDACYYVHRPAPCCPACGYEYPSQAREIEEVDGELQEVTSAPKVNKKQEIGIVARRDGLNGLVAYGQTQGYRNPYAWARQQMKVRGLA